MIRVNKVTVYVSNTYDQSIITLYKTNTKLAEITNRQLDIPDFHKANVDRNTYQQYCKDVVINLLENNGIEGFYWEAKQDNNDGQARKFSSSTFRAEAISRLITIMDMIVEDTDMTYEIHRFKNDEVEIRERYKDMSIKYGSTLIMMTVSKLTKSETVEIIVELKSGQMCKPKTFKMSDGSINQLNVTTLNRILK